MQLYHFLAVTPWAIYVTSLKLHHLLFNREIYGTYPPGGLRGFSELMCVKCRVQFLTKYFSFIVYTLLNLLPLIQGVVNIEKSVEIIGTNSDDL